MKVQTWWQSLALERQSSRTLKLSYTGSAGPELSSAAIALDRSYLRYCGDGPESYLRYNACEWESTVYIYYPEVEGDRTKINNIFSISMNVQLLNPHLTVYLIRLWKFLGLI